MCDRPIVRVWETEAGWDVIDLDRREVIFAGKSRTRAESAARKLARTIGGRIEVVSGGDSKDKFRRVVLGELLPEPKRKIREMLPEGMQLLGPMGGRLRAGYSNAKIHKWDYLADDPFLRP